MPITNSRPLYLVFVGRVPLINDTVGEQEVSITSIDYGQRLELGAIVVERPPSSDHVEWFNQVASPNKGMLLIDDDVRFDSGEVLALFTNVLEADEFIKNYGEELEALAADLLG